MRTLPTLAAAAVVAALAVPLTACDVTKRDGASASAGQSYDASPTTLTIVAGSEQKAVVTDIVQPWCSQNGLTCKVTYKGSVDQARLVQRAGESTPYDVYWFASSVWRQLGDKAGRLQNVQATSITPVVFAGRKKEMERLGLASGKDVTVQDIAKVVETEKKTWISNPTQSNSGATAYFSFLNAYAGNKPGVPLTQAQLDSPQVQGDIKKLVQAFATTPPSTGTLMDDCLAAPDRCKTLFTYEDLVMQYNKDLVAKGEDPLYAVYPKGALAISDAPLGFMPHATEKNSEKRAAYDKLVTFLTSRETQDKLASYGRRPVASIGLDVPNAPKDVFNPAWGIRTSLKEQPITFPASDVIESALSSYQTALRLPADTAYCIDGSGSMAKNGGWDGVDRANDALFDPAQASANLLQLNPADSTTVLIFNEGIKGGPWTVKGNGESDVRGLHQNIADAGPDGGTGIYVCLRKAAELLPRPSEQRRSLVILMTDGQDTERGQEQAMSALKDKGIPVVTIGFGSDADKGTLQDIANQTRGASFEGGSTPDDVALALRQATAYK